MSQAQHQQSVQSCVLCGRDHANGHCAMQSQPQKRKITWEIKVIQVIMKIIIKDGSLIQAWEKSNFQIGHLNNTNNNIPLGMKGC